MFCNELIDINHYLRTMNLIKLPSYEPPYSPESTDTNKANNMTDLISQLRNIVGDKGLLLGDDISSRSAGFWQGGALQAKALLRPQTTQQVAEVLQLCRQHQQTVVTQGGCTSLVDSHHSSADNIVLSTERMNAIESIDIANRTVTVQAGLILEQLQQAVSEQQLSFPVDFGARGSCTLGGMMATNAGGNSVLRYGMMREQVLGIEAVLMDGTVISSMTPYLKNNTGYDLKQLFIGSEGTLGVITRAVLRLRPQPLSSQTSLVATDDFTQVSQLLSYLDQQFNGGLSAYEVMWQDFYALNTGEHSHNKPPMPADYNYYVLLEYQGNNPASDAQHFENILGEAFEAELIVDAVIAKSDAERIALWEIRDDAETEKAKFGCFLHTFDVSLAIGDMPLLIKQLHKQLEQAFQHYELLVFGHLADGNLHLCIWEDGMQRKSEVENIVYQEIAKLQGSISAEHGIGLEKRDHLHHSRSPAEIALMWTVKNALDPQHLLNPGKTLPKQ